MEKSKNNSLYEFISSTSNEGFRYVNYETGYVIASAKWRDLFGIEKGKENDESSFKDILFKEDREKFRDKIERILGKQEESYEIEYRIKDGTTWIAHTGTHKYDKEGILIEKFSFFRDITKEKEKQLELEYMAYFDADTGVYNRNYFIKRLDRAIGKVLEGIYKRIQVMYLHIDNFNVVYDSIGFERGDELLIKFAKLLLQYSSHVVKVGRFSNNEFAIALYDAETENEIVDIYNDITDKLLTPFILSDGNEVYINVSAGITSYPEGGLNATELIKCADIAMYNVKRNSKNSMCIFEESMLNKFLKNVKLEKQLKIAVENLNFVLYYQPQYYASRNELRGVEALIRWKINENEFVNPGDFIPMAEKNGCIVDIGEWVIRKALEDFVDWKMNYGYNGMISINISAVQLKDPDFSKLLTKYVKDKNVLPSDVEIEITESVLIQDFDITTKTLSELRKIGFKVSLDDFGTGYSSLSYLKNIPIDTLKIDKSFIDTVLTDTSTGIITDAVIKMVKQLGLETIAEGVETEEQYEYLKKVNCDNIQGFLLGKPMDSASIIELIKKLNDRY
ncbi:MAG: EAL domain-containing protein [Lachnospiraceae bacterium]|nr:EAL domain-containing protein [Lachnospiraceae bacterium]MDE6253379.1 EAL domain-containing protein [Lachnospiraceae bacterium]